MSLKQIFHTYIEPAMVLLSHIGFMVLMASLPLSKGTSSVTLGIVTGFSILFLLFSGLTHRPTNYPYRLTYLFWLFFGCYLLGLLYSNQIGIGIKVAYKQNAYLLIPFIVLVGSSLVKWHGVLYLKWFVWGTAFACLVTVSLYLLPVEVLQQISGQLPRWGLNKFPQGVQLEKFGFYAPFIDRLSISYFISLSAITCCWLIAARQLTLWFSFILLILFLFTSLILGGRGGQLGLLAGLMIWIGYAMNKGLQRISLRGRLLKQITLLALMLTLVVGIPYVLFNHVPVVWERYNQLFWELSMLQNNTYQTYDYQHFTSLRRICSWIGSWELIKHNPLLGVGTGDFRYEMQQIYLLKGWDIPVNAHNQLLQIWATIGLAGIVLFCGIIFAFLRHLYKYGNSLLRVFGVSIIVFYGVVFLFDSALNMQASHMTFVLFLSMLALQTTRFGKTSAIENSSETKLNRREGL